MKEPQFPDYYDLLQLSPRADLDTIHRVFRHLAKRLHPDNGDSGNAEQFQVLVEAFRILSDPVERARYDTQRQEMVQRRWRIFDQRTALDTVAADRRIRAGILTILYAARRNDADRAGVGILYIEELLGCPEEHLRFHIWYLKENGFIQRLDNGLLAITAAGVDHVIAAGGPFDDSLRQLESGSRNGAHGNGSR